MQASGYSSWEASRFQVCQCDGGYMGPNCASRTCPRGDDPETNCAAGARQVQVVSVDFGTIPSSLWGTLPASLYATDEMVLRGMGAMGAGGACRGRVP